MGIERQQHHFVNAVVFHAPGSLFARRVPVAHGDIGFERDPALFAIQAIEMRFELFRLLLREPVDRRSPADLFVILRHLF